MPSGLESSVAIGFMFAVSALDSGCFFSAAMDDFSASGIAQGVTSRSPHQRQRPKDSFDVGHIVLGCLGRIARFFILSVQACHVLQRGNFW